MEKGYIGYTYNNFENMNVIKYLKFPNWRRTQKLNGHIWRTFFDDESARVSN